MVGRANKPPGNLDRIFLNSTMASEWDVLMEIWTTRQSFEDDNAPTFIHIKGHQDQHKPYGELSLSAQLNVDADALANQYMRDHPDLDYSPTIMFPSCKAQLHLRDGTATHRLKQFLRDARLGPSLQTKLKEKYKWSQQIFQDVDWEAARIGL